MSLDLYNSSKRQKAGNPQPPSSGGVEYYNSGNVCVAENMEEESSPKYIWKKQKTEEERNKDWRNNSWK